MRLPRVPSHPFRYRLARELAPEEAAAIAADAPGVWAGGSLVVAPANAAWLAEEVMCTRRLDFGVEAASDLAQRVWWRDVAARVFEPAGPVRAWVDAYLLPYQKIGILFALCAPAGSAALHWPTGAGKTLAAIIWAAYYGLPTLFVTKAAARLTIYGQYAQYTSLSPLVLLPKSERPASAPDPLEQLRESAEAQRPPPVVIVAWETLADYVDAIRNSYPFGGLVLDESHKAKMHRRWAAVPGTGEGERPTFRRLKNVASAAQAVGANARHRLETTATPIPDRPRDLWAQLDLLHPGTWGRAWDWFHRYCDVARSQDGYLTNTGESNAAELKKRMSFVAHVVDSAETRRALPPLRRQVVVVTRAMQSAPSGFARELARAKKQGRRNLVEVRLAEAASRKRAYVVGEVTEAFAGGGKGVIFTGRHADCERLGDALRKAAPTVAIWVAHGGHGTGVRDEIREAYMAHAGPCAIVGTGEAWGESFNLQDTDLAVFAQLPINYRQLWQWEGRFARHGQRRPVRVLYPVAEGSIDEHLQSILLDKLPAVAKLHGDSQAAEAERALQGRDRDDEIVSRLFEKIAGLG